MSDLVLTTGEDVNLTIIDEVVNVSAIDGPTLNFYDVIRVESTFDIQAYFDGLPSYADDTEARADGLTTNDLYWFSELTDTGIYNTLKRVSPL